VRLNPNVVATELPPLLELTATAERLAAEGRDVIRLDQGAVDVPPPPAFAARLVARLADPDVHEYAPDPGLPELRTALARHGHEAFGAAWDPAEELIVTAGANQAAFAAILALAGPGDEVLLPAPWYFNHAMALTAIGARPVPLRTDPDRGFVPTPDAVAAAITPRTRGLVLVNPNNPTGVRYPDHVVRQVTELVVAEGLWILADQTYHELAFEGGAALSPAAVPGADRNVVTVGSFSKSLGLAGWRVGFLAGPAELVRQVLKVQDSSVICAPRAAQVGLLAALPDARAHAAKVRTLLSERRDRLMTALRDVGLDGFAEPRGGLFLFLALPGHTDDWAFCRRLLEREWVAAVPGATFGPGGGGSIRISFGSTPADRLAEAARRLARAVGRL
jgi:aspartate/methionine/tyrosine aminotransferase